MTNGLLSVDRGHRVRSTLRSDTFVRLPFATTAQDVHVILQIEVLSVQVPPQTRDELTVAML